MLREMLSKFYTQYSDLIKFNSIEQFDSYYLKWWENNNREHMVYDDEGEPANLIEETKRSEIKEGIHVDPKDEKDRLAWLKKTLQISLLVGNITSPILQENSLDIRKAMFKRCMSEFDELYKQVNEKQFIVKKYPFILEELIKLKESVINKCGYLDEKDTNAKTIMITNPKIQWNGGVASLADLFCKLLFEKKLPKGKTYINEEYEDVVIDLIFNSFVDTDGKSFEKDTLRRYIRDKKAAKRYVINIDNLDSE